MNSICSKCIFAGNVAESLQKEGWIGCRKPLAIIQDSLNHPDPRVEGKSADEISANIYSLVTCKETATGWVDNGPLGTRTGRSFNGILMTKGTTFCGHFEKKSKQ